ncbi:beta-galactosidase [Paenibacillus sp. GCM10027626]|uniref:beta-galactosidase n=1 Tax=Paenibacillus sp. GCM10027626 TaxID=3273411 RepID=UPI00363F2E43
MYRKMLFTVLSMFIVAAGVANAGSASSLANQQFPIGIFWPPSPAQMTDASYADISAMHANFIVGGNGVSDFASNALALTYAANNGLKILVDDSRLAWQEKSITQEATGHGFFVSNSTSLGQTFRTPAGTGWGLNTVQLYIDKLNWPAGFTITLSLYDSPAKQQLIAKDAITAPVSTYYPVFNLHTAIQSDREYYWELTSDNPTPIGWVTTSSGDVYDHGQAYRNGVAQAFDFWFRIGFSQRTYQDGTQPPAATIDEIANYYREKNAVKGYHVLDEPSALQMTSIQNTIRRIKATDPDHMSFVNLLPSYASLAQLGLDQKTGEYVTDQVSLGQTFTTKKGQTYIDSVQWWIDKGTWGAGEALQLKLWDSPAKTSLIAQDTISVPDSEWQQFHLNTAVKENTMYYMELTHNGGGDKSIGWVIRSNTNDNWYNDGSAYINGVEIAADFWFTINQNIVGGSYEDYVYRWMYTEPDVLAFDHYPYLANGQFRSDYYANLEVIRRQAKLGNRDFWSYIQSVGVNGVWRAPSESEMRYQIYSNLAYGAKGYIYFTYMTPESSGGESFNNGIILPNGMKNASFTWAQNVNEEVQNLGGTLMKLKSTAVYHSGSSLPASTVQLPAAFMFQPNNKTLPLLISSFEHDEGDIYVMVVNKNTASAQTVSFSIAPAIVDVKEVSKTNGQLSATNFAAGSLTINLAAGEGKLYKVQK